MKMIFVMEQQQKENHLFFFEINDQVWKKNKKLILEKEM